MREPFTVLAEMLLARGWRWSDELGVRVLMAPHGTIWLDETPHWNDVPELLDVMLGRLNRIVSAGPMADDVPSWEHAVADTRGLVQCIGELPRETSP